MGAQECARPEARAKTTGTRLAAVSSAGDDGKTPAKQAAPPEVSKVGEKSAPLKSSEEENKLSPSERRKKVLREYYRSHIDPVGRIVADELSKLKDEENLVKQRLPHSLVMEELEKPRQAYIFKRGLYKVRGENVSAASPAVLPPMPKGRRAIGLGWRNGSFPVNIRSPRAFWSTASGNSISAPGSSRRPRISAPGVSSPPTPSSSIISPLSWSMANGT